MKFCKDCKWCGGEPSIFTGRISPLARCGNPNGHSGYVMVTGRLADSEEYCRTKRVDDTQCGRAAKWFEPRTA